MNTLFSVLGYSDSDKSPKLENNNDVITGEPNELSEHYSYDLVSFPKTEVDSISKSFLEDYCDCDSNNNNHNNDTDYQELDYLFHPHKSVNNRQLYETFLIFKEKQSDFFKIEILPQDEKVIKNTLKKIASNFGTTTTTTTNSIVDVNNQTNSTGYKTSISKNEKDLLIPASSSHQNFPSGRNKAYYNHRWKLYKNELNNERVTPLNVVNLPIETLVSSKSSYSKPINHTNTSTLFCGKSWVKRKEKNEKSKIFRQSKFYYYYLYVN